VPGSQIRSSDLLDYILDFSRIVFRNFFPFGQASLRIENSGQEMTSQTAIPPSKATASNEKIGDERDKFV